MIFAALIAECRLALETDSFDPKKRVHFNINDIQLPQHVKDKMAAMKTGPKPRSEDPTKRQYDIKTR